MNSVHLGKKSVDLSVISQRRSLGHDLAIFIYLFHYQYLCIKLCFQKLISAVQSSYSLRCQPVDYSDDPRALRVYVHLILFSSSPLLFLSCVRQHC